MPVGRMVGSIGPGQNLIGKAHPVTILQWMKHLIILLFPNFEEIEAIATADILRRSGLKISLCRLADSPTDTIEGAHKIRVATDSVLPENLDDFDGIVLPGGPGIFELRNNSAIGRALMGLDRDQKLIAAICAAPLLLADAKVLGRHRFTAHPCANLAGADRQNGVLRDGNFITASGPDQTFKFALEVVDYLLGREKREEMGATFG